jgi:DNA-binding NtrC family response regulator
VQDPARVLVVDDEEVQRTLLEKALRRAGYQVELARSAEDALARFAPRRFDVVLTDLRMPGRSGLDLLDEIRAADPDAAVVVMTAFGTIEAAVAAVKRGAEDFIPKPLHLDQLELVLSRALQRRRTAIEVENLRALADTRESVGGLVGASRAMREVFRLIDRVAGTDHTVLIGGESGTGKELCARAIHAASARRDRRFQPVNCAAIPDALLESELFGHEKGAFTGADSRKIGHIEVASGGTLFLDEIGEAKAAVQTKLLRVLQEREVVRVGATDAVKVDVRVICATNKDLAAEVAAQRFREDLFYRLNVFPIRMPPLRERIEDLPALVDHVLRRGLPDGTAPPAVSIDAMVALSRHPWPGNVRELENVVARARLFAGERAIGLEDLPPEVRADVRPAPRGGDAMAELVALPLRDARERFEVVYLERLLRDAHGNVSEVARRAGLGRPSLHEKLKKLGVDPDRFRGDRAEGEIAHKEES